MLDFSVLLTAFVVTFVAELPDKSLLAALVLGTRFRPRHVWIGVAAAFAVHVVLAVVAGGFLRLLPERFLHSVVAALFFLGAAWVLLAGRYADTGVDAAREGGPEPTMWRVAATGFLVVFLGEWGDVTQLTTANLAARYGDALSVGIGAVAALWAVTALAVTAGVKVLDRIPAGPLRIGTATILTGLGSYSAIGAVLG